MPSLWSMVAEGALSKEVGVTTFERLAHQRAKLQGQEIHRLSLRITRQKQCIKDLRMTILHQLNMILERDREIYRNEAVIAGQQAQIAKLQNVKA